MILVTIFNFTIDMSAIRNDFSNSYILSGDVKLNQ